MQQHIGGKVAHHGRRFILGIVLADDDQVSIAGQQADAARRLVVEHALFERGDAGRAHLRLETVEGARGPVAQKVQMQAQVRVGIEVGLVLVQQARHARQRHARQVAAASLGDAGRRFDAGGAPGAVVDVEQYGLVRHGLSSRCAVAAILAQSGVSAAHDCIRLSS
ncbi:hypothetical protein D3C72_1652110 [compost metagenome]